jgi:hypothetical protein
MRITGLDSQRRGFGLVGARAPECDALDFRVLALARRALRWEIRARLDVEELEEESFVAVQRHERALALPAHQHVFMHELIHCVAQCPDTDAHRRGDHCLARQHVARAKATAFHDALELAPRLPVERPHAARVERPDAMRRVRGGHRSV